MCYKEFLNSTTTRGYNVVPSSSSRILKYACKQSNYLCSVEDLFKTHICDPNGGEWVNELEESFISSVKHNSLKSPKVTTVVLATINWIPNKMYIRLSKL